MGRTGFDVSSPRDMAAVRELASLPGLEMRASSRTSPSRTSRGELHVEQFARFMRAADELEKRYRPQSGHEALRQQRRRGKLERPALDMVRPGLLLYGLYPGPEHGGLDLKPVMRLLTRVAEVTGTTRETR